jgi:hypothetical protein
MSSAIKLTMKQAILTVFALVGVIGARQSPSAVNSQYVPSKSLLNRVRAVQTQLNDSGSAAGRQLHLRFPWLAKSDPNTCWDGKWIKKITD